MPKYTVKLAALSDMIARIEVEATDTEQAVKTAYATVESAEFEIPEGGPEPMMDSVEVIEVEDENGETVEYPIATTGAIAHAITGEHDAELLDLARNIGALDENWLNFAQPGDLRNAIREYRDQARAALDHVNANDK
jgi:hypothetical protein